jgi:hypothetical protein
MWTALLIRLHLTFFREQCVFSGQTRVSNHPLTSLGLLHQEEACSQHPASLSDTSQAPLGQPELLEGQEQERRQIRVTDCRPTS